MLRRLTLAALTALAACMAHPVYAQVRTLGYFCPQTTLNAGDKFTAVAGPPGAVCLRKDSAIVTLPLTPAPLPTLAPTTLAAVTDLPPIVPLTNGWRIAYDASSVTVANDPTGLPALRMRFPAGMPSGESPATVYYGGSFSVARVRWESVLSYPLDYVKHPSSVDKSVFLTTRDSASGREYNAVYTMMYDPTRLLPAIGIQGTVSGTFNISANVTPVELQRGRRHTLTCEATGNSHAQANGVIECWLDGVKFLSRSGLQFTQGATRFIAAAWVPIWGGAGPALAREQSVYLGALRVWGR